LLAATIYQWANFLFWLCSVCTQWQSFENTDLPGLWFDIDPGFF